MELCSEGTLESLVEMSNGLHEGLTRRYTAQLLDAVAELHKHGVVHRDIKPANIFLTKAGNCLKLGDFGSAVKIQAHTTIPGELQAYVGTQAYMAPEVFTRNHDDGHGRAADIWSVGCVVIEMASGKVCVFYFLFQNKYFHCCQNINCIFFFLNFYFSDHGLNLIQISKLCSKLVWENPLRYQTLYQKRVKISCNIVWNIIRKKDGWPLNYFSTISVKSIFKTMPAPKMMTAQKLAPLNSNSRYLLECSSNNNNCREREKKKQSVYAFKFN